TDPIGEEDEHRSTVRSGTWTGRAPRSLRGAQLTIGVDSSPCGGNGAALVLQHLALGAQLSSARRTLLLGELFLGFRLGLPDRLLTLRRLDRRSLPLLRPLGFKRSGE